MKRYNIEIFSLVKLFVILFLSFGFFISMPTSSAEPEARVFHWKNAEGTALLTVQSKTEINPKTLFSNAANLEFKLVDQTPSIVIPKDWKSQTYQVFKSQAKSQKLIQKSDQSIIYLVGENHIGQAQKKVADVVAELIRDKEIDAIFIEQPDDLYYNWDSFKGLESNPTKAIAVFQTEMKKQADDTFLNPTITKSLRNLKSNDSIADNPMTAFIQLEQKLGEKGLESLMKAMEVKSAYEKSEYISAADYLYIMLNLQGLNIPFHNIESRKEREIYKKLAAPYKGKIPKKEDLKMLEKRDVYMTNSADQIIRDKKYNQVILICGAFHTDSLNNRLSQKGYQVKVAFQFSDQKIKNEMSVLVNPKYTKSLVDNYSGQELVVDNKLVVDNIPSKQLQDATASIFADILPSGGKAQRKNLMVDFSKVYEQGSLRSKSTWEVPLKLNDGTEIQIRKENALIIKMLKPAKVDDIQNLHPQSESIPVYDFDAGNIARLKGLDSTVTGIKTVTVKRYPEGKSERYVAYDQNGEFFAGDSAAELVDNVSKGLGKNGVESIYLDLENFPDHKADAFSASVAVAEHKNDLFIKTLRRNNGETINQKVIFEGRIIEDLTKSDSKITKVSEGKYKGWFHFVRSILIKAGETIHTINVHVYARTLEAATNLHASFELMAAKDKTLSLSLPALMRNAKLELKKVGFHDNFTIEISEVNKKETKKGFKEIEKSNFVEAVLKYAS